MNSFEAIKIIEKRYIFLIKLRSIGWKTIGADKWKIGKTIKPIKLTRKQKLKTIEIKLWENKEKLNFELVE